MTAEHVRDAAVTAVIFGFFASSWFGWAQEAPPRSWRTWLGIAAGFSLLTAVVGGLLAWRQWNDGTAFDESTSKTFGIIVGIEFGVAGLGAGVLALLKRMEFVSAWIALVVGLHFFPLAELLEYPALHVVAALVTVAALAAIPIARRTSVAVSAVTGVATGTFLLAGALFSAISVLF
jgi:hypothetical protein